MSQCYLPGCSNDVAAYHCQHHSNAFLYSTATKQSDTVDVWTDDSDVRCSDHIGKMFFIEIPQLMYSTSEVLSCTQQQTARQSAYLPWRPRGFCSIIRMRRPLISVSSNLAITFFMSPRVANSTILPKTASTVKWGKQTMKSNCLLHNAKTTVATNLSYMKHMQYTSF